MTRFVDSAIGYARLGWRVLPCRPGGKPPLNPGGVTNATRDEATIRNWWAKWPHANIGIAADTAVIVDVDPGANWPADEGQRQSLKATGCPLARTPRGGWHLFFAQPPGRHYGPSVSELAPHVDTRAGASYVLVAPSRSEHGDYQWTRPLVAPDELPLPPEWLVAALDAIEAGRTRGIPPGKKPPGGEGDELGGLAEGQRNVALFRLACRLRRAGLSASEIESALQTANAQRCQPPLPPAEVATIARSAGRYPAGGPPALEAMPYALRRAWGHAIAHRRKVLRKGGRA